MVFYSNNFTFNNIYSKDTNIHLVSEDTGILNDYGIPFNIEEDSSVTLSFCRANKDKALAWDYDTTVDFLGWIITDDFCDFISEDNDDLVYFLKGVSYNKRFTNDMKGIIDVTFKVLSPYGYKHDIREIPKNEASFHVYNFSNIDNAYKPVITLSNISSSNITITNTTTNKEPFYINNLTSSDTIYIDNLFGTITDHNKNNKLMNSNRNWIELSKGSNIFSVKGSCNIRIEAYYPIMV